MYEEENSSFVIASIGKKDGQNDLKRGNKSLSYLSV